MNKNELKKIFVDNLLSTNRGFNYYVDWKNISGFNEYSIEINAIDVLIGCKDDNTFQKQFFALLEKLPSTILLFPFLFGLAKVERKAIYNNKCNLTIISEEIDSPNNTSYNFSLEATKKSLTKKQIEIYYDFFVQMGLKNLYQNLIEKSTLDYIIGVLVGLDSNGRKNRGGKAFELACQPIIEAICKHYNIKLYTQSKFHKLRELGFEISEDISNRKADFIIVNEKTHKALNIEVNFYNDSGSKPEEIIDSYINRQNDLKDLNIDFALITDGNCWFDTTNQLKKGFRHLNYIMNYHLLKTGFLDEIVKENLF